MRRVDECMGTVFSIDVRDPDVGEPAIDDVVHWLHWVDSTFSTYQPGSEISRLARGDITLRECDPQVRKILDLCDDLDWATSGYFSAYANGVLDPSGVVKGWAIEQASELLRAAGSANHCINGGGDVQCAGEFEPGQPWRIGVAHPLESGRLAGVVAGNDIAVATSGAAERGQHIVDPHTRRPPTALAAVTVVGQHLTYVDAYATAAFAMGDRAQSWLEGLPGYWAFGITADGAAWRTTGFADTATTPSATSRR
jgi:thiamine biosynthesis lipoprotein